VSARRAAAAVCLLLAGPPAAADGRAAEVAAWLSGTFEKGDPPAAGASDAVRIVIVAVPKSRIANGSPVLYREEAAAPRLDEPSAQRFFRLEEDGEAVRLRAFDPKDPLIVRGKWRDPSVLAFYGSNDLRERPGCAILLKKTGEAWEGGTQGTGCLSNRRGASTMTSALSVSKDGFTQWDRGFDDKGRQTWGSAEGGTRFVKRSVDAPVDDRLMERPVGRRAGERPREGISANGEESAGSPGAAPVAGEAAAGGGFSANGKEGTGGAASEGAAVATAPVAGDAITLLGPYSPSKKYGLTELRAMAGNASLPLSKLLSTIGAHEAAATVVVVTSRARGTSVFSSAEIFSSSPDAPSLDVSSSALRLVAGSSRGLDDVVSVELRVLAPAK
jgi:hypothetical protein